MFLFILFFQVQLYADMFLQVFFFVVTLYGWYNWKQMPKENDITKTELKTKIWLLSAIVVGTTIVGFLISNIHMFLFYKKGITFLALEYFVFLGLATYGFLNWKKQLNNG